MITQSQKGIKFTGMTAIRPATDEVKPGAVAIIACSGMEPAQIDLALAKMFGDVKVAPTRIKRAKPTMWLPMFRLARKRWIRRHADGGHVILLTHRSCANDHTDFPKFGDGCGRLWRCMGSANREMKHWFRHDNIQFAAYSLD